MTTTSSFEALRSQEYAVLREELRINRQFVFERPLRIVGVSLRGNRWPEGDPPPCSGGDSVLPPAAGVVLAN